MKDKVEEKAKATTQSEVGEAGPEIPAREVWEAQPLSLGNTARMIRLLAGQLIQKLILSRSDLQGASDTEVISAVLQVLDEESLAQFLSIATDQPVQVIRETYHAAKAIRVAVDFLRINEFGVIWGEARRLGGAGQPRKKRGQRRSTSKK